VIGRQLLRAFAPSAVLFLLLGSSLHHRLCGGASRIGQAPKMMLWAWERPERLSFLDSSSTGVAYLAETIYPKGNGFLVHPRLQPLEVPTNAYLEAVVRIEIDRKSSWCLSDKELDRLAAEVVKVTKQPRVRALQIDFDARESERSLYKELLKKVRVLLPNQLPLSITALSSWCMGDKWLEDAPVDEIVPMLFSMGAGREESLDFIRTSDTKNLSYFQKCFGLSVRDSEPAAELSTRIKLADTRLYFFSARPWNPTSVQHAQDEVRIWESNSSNQ